MATSEKLSPVSWKISPSRKMGHCGSRVLWKVQVVFKPGKMFLLHMMKSKQASQLKTGILLFHGSEPVWPLAPWGPPTILPSGFTPLCIPLLCGLLEPSLASNDQKTAYSRSDLIALARLGPPVFIFSLSLLSPSVRTKRQWRSEA